MIPFSFLEIADSNFRKDYYKQYFNNQYPDSDDCIILDKQTRDIELDILKIIEHKETTKVTISAPCIIGIDFMCSSFNNKKSIINPEYTKAIVTRNLSKAFLSQLLNNKRNKQINLDCRNKIETKRQNETAQIFSNTSEKSETRILSDTKKKQYFLAIIGASVMLTGLVVLLIKNNK